MSGSKSRDKGTGGEREAATELNWVIGVEAHRGRQYQGSPESPDVKADIPGVHIEVKRVEALSFYPAMEKAASDSGEDIPMLMHRRNHKPWIVCVYLEDLPCFVNRISEAMNKEQSHDSDHGGKGLG